MSSQQPEKVETFPQALQLLVDGVQVAQKRGAFSLQESALIYQAIVKIQEETVKKGQQQKVEEI